MGVQGIGGAMRVGFPGKVPGESAVAKGTNLKIRHYNDSIEERDWVV